MRPVNRKYQRGYLGNIFPSTGEMVGCLGICALAFVMLGVFIAWLFPIVWDWLRPLIHGATA